MLHTYKIDGMTCGGCEATVKSSLLKLPDVRSVEFSNQSKGLSNQSPAPDYGSRLVSIDMVRHISPADLQHAIGTNSKYRITELAPMTTGMSDSSEQVTPFAKDQTPISTFSIYKPLFILFALILIISIIVSFKGTQSSLTTYDLRLITNTFMNCFMAGFFLSFSYFKLINLNGFAESYRMYDIVAKRIKAWGYIYPFAELGLGIAYATGNYPFATNIATIVIMGISSAGVIESVANKKKIQCACLGTVFNLPMSTITIIEDLLMVAMAVFQLVI